MIFCGSIVQNFIGNGPYALILWILFVRYRLSLWNWTVDSTMRKKRCNTMSSGRRIFYLRAIAFCGLSIRISIKNLIWFVSLLILLCMMFR